MKTLKIIILIISCNSIFSQTRNQYKALHNDIFFSVGIDVKNAIIGSKPTNDNPEIDALLRLGVTEGHTEVSIIYENFNRINYQSYGVNVNYVYETFIKNLNFAYGLEGGSIIREKNKNFFFGGLNLEARYKITDKMQISLLSNYKLRNDLKELKTDKLIFRYSGYLNLIYKLN